MTRLVASSMLRPFDRFAAPLSAARGGRRSAAISASGWRTVVRGGEVQRDSGRSSKPTRLRWLGTRYMLDAGRLEHSQSLEVAAGEDGGRGFGSASMAIASLKPPSTWKSPHCIRSGSRDRPAASMADR